MAVKTIGTVSANIHPEAATFLNSLPYLDELGNDLSLSKKILKLKPLWDKYGVRVEIDNLLRDAKIYLEVLLTPAMGNVIFKLGLFSQRALNVIDIQQRNELIDELSDNLDLCCQKIGLLRHEEDNIEPKED